jgi:hypothetical protein
MKPANQWVTGSRKPGRKRGHSLRQESLGKEDGM